MSIGNEARRTQRWFGNRGSRIRDLISGPGTVTPESASSSVVQFNRQHFGPGYTLSGETELVIADGGLAGQTFRLKIETRGKETTIDMLFENLSIGQCAIQHNRWGHRITIWNIMFDESWRGKGLASVLMRTSIRSMLFRHGASSLALREVRLIDANQGATSFKNIGIGIITHQLGFEPEWDLTHLLRTDNIESVELVSARDGKPSGYMFMLRSEPHALALLLIDPETGRAYPEGHRVYDALITNDSIREWVDRRLPIVGDANYVLRAAGIPSLISHVADSEEEARQIAELIQPVE